MALLLLSSCGFHLRGSVEIPERYRQLSLKANPKSNFTKALVEQLQLNSIEITEDAQFQLAVLGDEHEQLSLIHI